MVRSRMIPTCGNFPGRWKKDDSCIVCGRKETDEHLFTCPGYSIETLREAAGILGKIIKRLEIMKNIER